MLAGRRLKMLKKNIWLLIIIVLLFLAFNAIVIVKQSKQALVINFNANTESIASTPLRVLKPGIHFKIPFIQSIYSYNIGLKALPIHSAVIIDKNKNILLVSSNLVWKIININAFYKSFNGDIIKAQQLLIKNMNQNIQILAKKNSFQNLISLNATNKFTPQLTLRINHVFNKLGINISEAKITQFNLPPTAKLTLINKMQLLQKNKISKTKATNLQTNQIKLLNARIQSAQIIAKANNHAKLIDSKTQEKNYNIYLQSYLKNKKLFAILRHFQFIANNPLNQSLLIKLNQAFK